MENPESLAGEGKRRDNDGIESIRDNPVFPTVVEPSGHSDTAVASAATEQQYAMSIADADGQGEPVGATMHIDSHDVRDHHQSNSNSNSSNSNSNEQQGDDSFEIPVGLRFYRQERQKQFLGKQVTSLAQQCDILQQKLIHSEEQRLHLEKELSLERHEKADILKTLDQEMEQNRDLLKARLEETATATTSRQEEEEIDGGGGGSMLRRRAWELKQESEVADLRSTCDYLMDQVTQIQRGTFESTKNPTKKRKKKRKGANKKTKKRHKMTHEGQKEIEDASGNSSCTIM